MYSKLHCFTHFLIALAFGVAGAVSGACAGSPRRSCSRHGNCRTGGCRNKPLARAHRRPHGRVDSRRGHHHHQSAGTTVTTTTADAAGAYEVNGLAPGSYIVQASVAGFAPFASQAIQLAAGQVKRVDISMAMEVEQQSVMVTDESPRSTWRPAATPAPSSSRARTWTRSPTIPMNCPTS